MKLGLGWNLGWGAIRVRVKLGLGYNKGQGAIRVRVKLGLGCHEGGDEVMGDSMMSVFIGKGVQLYVV